MVWTKQVDRENHVKEYPVYFHKTLNCEEYAQKIQAFSREEIDQYVEKFYRMFAYLTLKEDYSMIFVDHCWYVGYAASLIKERMNVPYTLILNCCTNLSPSTFPDPILALKTMIEADEIIVATSKEKETLLTEYSKDNVIDHEVKHNGFTRIEAEQRYRIYVGDQSLTSSKIVTRMPNDLGTFATV